MTSIEKRIEKHKQAMITAERMFTRYSELQSRWDNKYRFHENAITNLEKKQKNNMV